MSRTEDKYVNRSADNKKMYQTGWLNFILLKLLGP